MHTKSQGIMLWHIFLQDFTTSGYITIASAMLST